MGLGHSNNSEKFYEEEVRKMKPEYNANKKSSRNYGIMALLVFIMILITYYYKITIENDKNKLDVYDIELIDYNNNYYRAVYDNKNNYFVNLENNCRSWEIKNRYSYIHDINKIEFICDNKYFIKKYKLYYENYKKTKKVILGVLALEFMIIFVFIFMMYIKTNF